MVTEKRLIDKDKLIEKCDAPHWCVWMSEIEDFPTVDAVEVVRCKDCKYRAHDRINQEHYCNHDLSCQVNVRDNDFCSYGERKCNGC